MLTRYSNYIRNNEAELLIKKFEEMEKKKPQKKTKPASVQQHWRIRKRQQVRAEIRIAAEGDDHHPLEMRPDWEENGDSGADDPEGGIKMEHMQTYPDLMLPLVSAVHEGIKEDRLWFNGKVPHVPKRGSRK